MGDVVALRTQLEIYGQQVTQDQITGVTFKVQTPPVTTTVATQYTLPATTITLANPENIPTSGQVYIQDSTGVEVFSYTGLSGSNITGVTGGTTGAIISTGASANFVNTVTQQGIVENDGSAYVLWSNTQEAGPYTATCQFSLITGEKRTTFVSFSVINPFNPAQPSPVDQVTEAVWTRLSDIFDSTEGGPWLRDRTLDHFDQNKIAQFIPEALFDINVQMPPTNYDITMFTIPANAEAGQMNPSLPLLVKGVLCLTIRHLMRSYTEIYTPTGQGQMVWADRTRYQQAWGQIYDIEYKDYIAALRLFKRGEYNFGHSALLTSSKAGRLYPYTNYASRGIYRGY